MHESSVYLENSNLPILIAPKLTTDFLITVKPMKHEAMHSCVHFVSSKVLQSYAIYFILCGYQHLDAAGRVGGCSTA